MKGRLRDLTGGDTIYRVEMLGRRKLRTIRVRRRLRLMTRTKNGGPTAVTGLADALALFGDVFARLDPDQEHWVMLVLNTANHAEGYKILGSGVQDHVHVDCTHVFRSALLLGACSIVVAHNHPYGSLEPSPRDMEVTTLLVVAGRVLEIPVLDHLILGQHGAYISLYDQCTRLFVDAEGQPDMSAGDAGG